jgi:hypothetical protein
LIEYSRQGGTKLSGSGVLKFDTGEFEIFYRKYGWSATTVSTDTTQAWNYTLDVLDSLYTGPKSGSIASVICVRGI